MKKTIVCFGDSNTHGYCAETGGRFDDANRYPGLLQSYLGDKYLVREEGLSGRTTVFDDPLFEGLNGLSCIFPCLMSHEPVNLLIIMLGTNDVKERFGCNAQNIAKGMERLVRKAMNTDAWAGGIPRILIVAPPPIEEGYEDTFVKGEMGKGCAEKSRELALHYKNTAELTGCSFLDAGSIPGMKMHPNDHMHFTRESHQLLAQELAKLIPSLLEDNRRHT